MRLFHNEWEKWAAIIIIVVLIFIGLSSCRYRMVPNETKIEYGTTETDSKNDKVQQKQFITQSWKWEQR